MIRSHRMMMGAAKHRAAGPDWWALEGIPTAYAAWQAKGASSYAASKVNLANPGTYDLTELDANIPNWSKSVGWTFSGSERLVPGINTSGSSWSCLVRFDSSANYGTTSVVMGAWDQYGSSYLVSRTGGELYHRYAYGTFNNFLDVSPALTSGIMGFAGKAAYLDGGSDGTIPSNFAGPAGYVGIGNVGASVRNYPFYGNVVAAIWWNEILTPTNMATVTTAMASI